MGSSNQRIYIDTNVFLNYIYEEPEKPEIVEPSILLLEDTKDCKYFLVASDGMVREIQKITQWEEDKILEKIFRPFELLEKIEWVKTTKQVAEEATYLYSLYGIHRADAIHAAMASMYDCWLITYDRELKKAAKTAGLIVYDPRELT